MAGVLPPRLQVASWNVNSLRVRLPQVLSWLSANNVDVLGLQETKLTDQLFPVAELRDAGYEALYSGQAGYNGVALLVRESLRTNEIVKAIPEFDHGQRRVLLATVGDLRIANLYVPNGEAVGTDKYRYKLDWLGALHGFLSEELKRFPRLIVMGDFNVAPADADVYAPEIWKDRVLYSEPERRALHALFGLGLEDAFRRFEQPQGSY